MSCSGSKIPEDADPENPLWQFACRFWESGSARQACLTLQNQGWSVTRILCAGWLATAGRPFTGHENDTVTQWRAHVTEPLRAARQYISKNNRSTDTVRASIARSEIEAEQVELALAYQALASRQSTGRSESVTANLARNNFLAAAPEKTMDNGTSRLLDTLARELLLLEEGDI